MIRKIARPMLASVFIIDGAKTVMNPSSNKESAASVLEQVRAAVPRQYRSFLPQDPETAAQIVGGVKAGAGSLFAIGKLPRTAAALLTATSAASLVGRNAFWNTDDEDEKLRRRAGALTDLALTGGVLLASVDTAGKPDIKWRAQNAARVAKKNVQQALPTQSETEKALHKASNWFSDATEQVGDYIEDNKGDWAKAANRAGSAAQDLFGDARKQTSHFLSNASDWLEDATDELQDNYKDLKPSKLDQLKAKRKVNNLVDDAKGWAEDAFDELTPSKLEKFKAKRKVNSVVSDLQASLDDLGPSTLDKFRAKRKVKKSAAKLQDKAQEAVDSLQDAWDNLDVAPSWRQKRKWKKRANKAEKQAKKLVKKAQKKLG
ncbi:DoxX family membrane protein [Corynebacterium riegelii]|uniref:DoxX family membrane protein n=1 Tax=Corynebacterium riegelii TaxID=156976 RepID=UPI000C7847EE|nr:DoxX family membrane protein [Corynebacterium riegelii]PLA11527.1 DoxX family protein [Corynebacterium riegelii]QQU83489.1 DoxX family membrane protein [Corynebacterium riegelii]